MLLIAVFVKEAKIALATTYLLIIFHMFSSLKMSEDVATDEAADISSEDSTDLPDMLASARDLLNASRFDDAESAFLKLYHEIQVNICCI